MKRTLACMVVAIAGFGAGCGDDDDDGGASTTPVAATTPAAQTTPAATTPAETTPASDDPDREEITVRGKRGETLTLIGQRDPKGREKVAVTVQRIRGPFSGYNLSEGRQLIGVDVKIANAGTLVYDDPQPGGTLTVVGGETGKQTNLITVGRKSPCDNPSLKLSKGQSKTVCVAFEIAKGAKPQVFQFAVDSGFGDTGVWTLG